MGLLSIYPTVKFLSWRKRLHAGHVPELPDAERRKLRTIIHAELTLIVLILLCAALMARGSATWDKWRSGRDSNPRPSA